jgi:hypothetical protein
VQPAALGGAMMVESMTATTESLELSGNNGSASYHQVSIAQLSPPRWPGVDVMITIFGDFCQIQVKKLAVFSNTNVMIKLLYNLALFWVKNANFCNFFRRKYF